MILMVDNFNEIASILDKYGYTLPEIFKDAVILIFAIVLLISPFFSYIKNIFSCKTRAWRDEYVKNRIGSNYKEYLISKNYRLYINTRFQNVNPDKYVDLTQSITAVSSENLISFYIDKVLKENNENQHLYCILAGSGMGKTTFLVHLFKEYINHYKKKNLPYDIYLLSLSRSSVIEEIEKIPKKGNSILLLDALDENPKAISEFEDFKAKLETAFEDFRYVIVTCRTQFFDTEKDELSESMLLNFGRNKGFKTYNKQYIAPFDFNDINNYIEKKYKWWSKKRKKAKKIMKVCTPLMVRPLLLSYIDDLLDEDFSELDVIDIYKLLIDKWLAREVANIQLHQEREVTYENLWKYSQEIALNIYHHRQERGGFYMSADDYKEFLEKHDLLFLNDFAHRLKGRSLLNRDSFGNIKFAHKSFLEYFLAFAKYKNPNKVVMNDMENAMQYYSLMVKKDFSKAVKDGIFKLGEQSIFQHDRITKRYISGVTWYSASVSDSLIVYKNAPCNYSLLFHDKNITRLSVSSHAITPQLKEWLIQSRVNTITVSKCELSHIQWMLELPYLHTLSVQEMKNYNLNEFATFTRKAKNKHLFLMIDGKCVISPKKNSILSEDFLSPVINGHELLNKRNS